MIKSKLKPIGFGIAGIGAIAGAAILIWSNSFGTPHLSGFPVSVGETGAIDRAGPSSTNFGQESSSGSYPVNARDTSMVEIASREGWQSAVDFIKREYPQADVQRAFYKLVAHFGDIDILKQALPHLTDSFYRTLAIDDVAKRIPHSGIMPAAKIAARELQGESLNRLMGGLTTRLQGAHEYELAFRLIELMPFSKGRTERVRDLARSLTRNDPVAAIRWASNITDEAESKSAESVVVAALSRNQDADSLRLLSESTKNNSIRVAATEMLGGIAAGKDVYEAIRAANELPLTERAVYLAGVASTARLEDFKVVGNALKEACVTPSKTSSLTNTYITRLFEYDQKQAVDWVTQVDPGIRIEAIRNLTRIWYRSDSEKVSEWVQQLPAGQERDAAAVVLSNSLRVDDKNAAKFIAGLISDKRSRDIALLQIR